MEVLVAVAIVVTILGVALICAVVFVTYRYRATSPDGKPFAPPMRKYIVEKGKLVRVPGGGSNRRARANNRPSARPSNRNSQWIRSAVSLHKGEDNTLTDISRSRRIEHLFDLEAAIPPQPARDDSLLPMPMNAVQEVSGAYSPKPRNSPQFPDATPAPAQQDQLLATQPQEHSSPTFRWSTDTRSSTRSTLNNRLRPAWLSHPYQPANQNQRQVKRNASTSTKTNRSYSFRSGLRNKFSTFLEPATPSEVSSVENLALETDNLQETTTATQPFPRPTYLYPLDGKKHPAHSVTEMPESLRPGQPNLLPI